MSGKINVEIFILTIRTASRWLYASFTTPSARQAQALLFFVGCVLLCSGLDLMLHAQTGSVDYPSGGGNMLSGTINNVFEYMEGSFGALVMVCGGFAALVSAAIGQYRAAFALLIIAVGAFITRSIVGTFFTDTSIKG